MLLGASLVSLVASCPPGRRGGRYNLGPVGPINIHTVAPLWPQAGVDVVRDLLDVTDLSCSSGTTGSHRLYPVAGNVDGLAVLVSRRCAPASRPADRGRRVAGPGQDDRAVVKSLFRPVDPPLTLLN